MSFLFPGHLASRVLNRPSLAVRPFEHPRFGLAASLVAAVPVPAGRELTVGDVSYHWYEKGGWDYGHGDEVRQEL